MRTDVQWAGWLGACLALVACAIPPEQALPQGQGLTPIQLTVQVPGKVLPGFGTKYIDLANATRIYVSYGGAGIGSNAYDYSAGLGPSYADFGAVDPGTGLRSATVSGSVLAGNGRRFYVMLQDPGFMNAFEGVANVPSNATTTVNVSRHTTMTARIFRELYKISVAKTLTVDPTAVQAVSDTLLNTNSVDGTALDGGQPQINVTHIHPNNALYQRIASMIANGEGAGAPWTPAAPASIPQEVKDMTVNAQQKGTVTVNALTASGLPLNDSCVIKLNDFVSSPVTTTQGNPASVTFNNVPLTWNVSNFVPNNWTATVTNTVTGEVKNQTVQVTANNGTYSLNLSMSPAAARTYAGTWTAGNNGNNLHPSISQVQGYGGMAYHNGDLYFVDSNNGSWSMVRKVTNLGNGRAIVNVAGTGAAGSNLDPTNPLNTQFSNPRSVAVDSAGNVYVGDMDNHRIVKITPANAVSVFYSHAVTGTGWPARNLDPWTLKIYNNGAGTELLYMGTRQYIYAFDLNQAVPGGGYTDTHARYTVPGYNDWGIYTTRTADQLFFSTYDASMWRIYRRDLTNSTNTIVAGTTNASSTQGTIGNVANISATAGLHVTPSGVLFINSLIFDFCRLSNALGADTNQMVINSMWNGSVGYAYGDIAADGSNLYYRATNGALITQAP